MTMTVSKKILPHILILLIWFSRGYCEGEEETICTEENERLCYLLCDSYRREIDLCSYFPSLCRIRVNCDEVAYRCWNEVPDCGDISITGKAEKRGAPTRGFTFLFLKLHPLFSQNPIPRLSTSTRYRRIGQRFGSEFLGKRHSSDLNNETNFEEEKRNKIREIRNFGSEFLGKRSEGEFTGNELLGKRGLEFLGKRSLEFLGKRSLGFSGKRNVEFLGKRGNEFLGKRGTEFLGKRGTEFLGKRGTEFLGKRGTEFLGKRGTELLGKRGTELLGKRGFEFLGKRGYEFFGKRTEAQDLDEEFSASNSSDSDFSYPLEFSKRGKGPKVRLGSEFLGKRFGKNPEPIWIRYPLGAFGEPEYRNYVKNDQKQDEKKYKTMNSNSNQKKERVLGKMISVSEFLG